MEIHSSYACANLVPSGPQACLSMAFAGATFRVSRCVAASNADICETRAIPLVSSITMPTTSGMTTWSYYTIYATMVEIRWQSSDQSSSFQILATGSASSITPTHSQRSHALSTGSSTTLPHSHRSHGLSNGSKEAMGVSIPIVVLVILVGVALFFRKRMQKSRESARESYKAAREAGQTASGMDVKDDRDEVEMPVLFPERARHVEARTLTSRQTYNGLLDSNPIEANPLFEAADTSHLHEVEDTSPIAPTRVNEQTLHGQSTYSSNVDNGFWV